MRINSDSDLVKRCLDGCPLAWEEFVDRFSSLIYWAIKRKLSRFSYRSLDSDADDIYQRLFVSIFEKKLLESVKDRENISPWLVVMASNMAIDFIRKRARDKAFLTSDSLRKALSEDNLSSYVSDEERDLLDAAIESLGEKEKAFIELHYISGKKHKDIALALGASINTVSTAIRRAKRKIVKYIEKNQK